MRGNYMFLKLNTSRFLMSKKLAGTLIAIFALFIQPLVALDAPSAFAATRTTLYSSSDIDPVSVGEAAAYFHSPQFSTLGYVNLELSFNYDITNLNDGDALYYGWGQGSMQGTFGTPSISSDNSDTSISVPLPRYAEGSAFYFRASVSGSSPAISTATLTNITVTGELVTPTATLFMPNLTSPQDVYYANDFTSTISDVANATGVNVRVKTTFTSGDPNDITFDYYEEGLPNEGYGWLDNSGNDFYYGPVTGFALQDTDIGYRLIFHKVGTYTMTSQIINVADDSVIFATAPMTIVVTDGSEVLPDEDEPTNADDESDGSIIVDEGTIVRSKDNSPTPVANPAVYTTSEMATETAGDSGDNDKMPEISTTGDGDDEKTSTDKVVTIAPNEEGWKLWGVAWYWYLLALGALGSGGWYAVRWYRNRESEF